MTNYEKPIEAIRRILWAEDNPGSADASMTQDAAYEDLDAWLASELRAARAETWDEGVAAIHAWWNAPEDQRPSFIINPYGVGLQGDEPA